MAKVILVFNNAKNLTRLDRHLLPLALILALLQYLPMFCQKFWSAFSKGGKSEMSLLSILNERIPQDKTQFDHLNWCHIFYGLWPPLIQLLYLIPESMTFKPISMPHNLGSVKGAAMI